MMIKNATTNRWHRWRAVIAAFFVLYIPHSVLAADTTSSPFAGTTVRLASLDWPPYTGENLRGQGSSAIISRQAFAVSNIGMTTVFYPWRRVLDSLHSDESLIGYYPEYKSADLEKQFYFSDSIGNSALGFVSLAGSAFDWTVPDDLKKWRIGVVAGYVNEPVFDRMMKNGDLKTLAANDDVTLLRLLHAKRIDAAVMDEQVLHYWIRTMPEFSAVSQEFVFHPHLLGTKTLHVVFRKTEQGRQLRDLFNYGLQNQGSNLISAQQERLLSQ
ncbi:ABC transporter substrate-binding protein [Thalassospira profundimaris]|uniref:substrate-binding periplasmic protein n=1 Tax=Thalassospira profundimaris TaxID=502049 RepID=UPI000DEE1AB6|nr:transporter substrate-binding domain-containing protein [Thalassospira profundimaris]